MSEPANNTKPLSENTGMTVVDGVHAPFIYFEEAPALGSSNGLIRVTLSAPDATLVGGVVSSRQVVTAYLRTNIQGALALRNAIDAALLMASPVENPDGPAN